VLKDYKGGNAVLLAAERAVNESGAFRMLLTPGNDPRSHYDHFHFEARTEREAYWGPEVEPRGR
jgi:hypothetical protein